MKVPPKVHFHNRPQGVAWTGASLLIASIILAMCLLAGAWSALERRGSEDRGLALVPGAALLTLNAGECRLNLARQGLLEHLSVYGAQIMSDPAQKLGIGND
ncbi:hypothetical protein [Microvirga roseola]|uniref:hypothetical protein n=1 Tax=Microvirga roseola TaxID=2883126 RepID=UPI001E6255AD|nr:hypothetical protein [Microvirga roseola]